jgi:hypothetical protein
MKTLKRRNFNNNGASFINYTPKTHLFGTGHYQTKNMGVLLMVIVNAIWVKINFAHLSGLKMMSDII